MTRTTRRRIWRGRGHRWFVLDQTGAFVGAYPSWDAAMHAAAQS